MLLRALQFIKQQKGATARPTNANVEAADLVWALGSLCALNRIPFDPELLLKQFPPPYTTDGLVHAARALGFRIKLKGCAAGEVPSLTFPCLIALKKPRCAAPAEPSAGPTRDDSRLGAPETCSDDGGITLAIVSNSSTEGVVLFGAGTNTPRSLASAEFAEKFAGFVFLAARTPQPAKDPDGAAESASFGFRWFIPELLKHRSVWREVVAASLVIQLLALGTPLFTQVVIDKVVVHRTESTLLVIAIGLAVFMVFSALLGWVRQYLVLHTGNRVDAVLAAGVFDHLFKLPPRYFERRPTGVIAARLNGVETIREFVAGAAVTLVLDLPFLLIFVAIMFWYSVSLTLIALGILAVITGLSLAMAPVFRTRLDEQFLLGARNQAFLTEYIVGLETVKSLQMEPQLKSRYGDYLADYLRAGFRTKQIANTYNTAANGLEQMMSLLILVVGAYTVMTGTDFTIGMLVAFQMFAGRLSQPMLRMVGLWQQFQQANLSVRRLGDIMNAPAEPYSVIPARLREGKGRIEIEDLSFRYGEDLPFLYQGLHISVNPGRAVAIMGPSGSGKSTLAKLLQGFYQPTGGHIKLDGTDIRHFSANELRHYFGVVPQETVLFSGTIYDNLLMANAHASFEQIAHACRMAEIHDVIEELPQGYQTEIGERGAGLSGGQKQRLAIARALLKRPKILIFDEAVSNLDQQTAENIAHTVNQLKGTVTVLFITHQIPKGLQVDEVISLGRRPKAMELVGEERQSGPKS